MAVVTRRLYVVIQPVTASYNPLLVLLFPGNSHFHTIAMCLNTTPASQPAGQPANLLNLDVHMRQYKCNNKCTTNALSRQDINFDIY